MLLNEDVGGVYAIAATPFDENGNIDLESIDRSVEFYLDAGVHGLTILGMMGEAHKLSSEESTAVMGRFLDRVAGRVPIVVGVSAAGNKSVLDLSKAAMDRGAAGVMIAPIPSLKTEQQIYRYFATIFDHLDAPTVFQDFPQATSVHVSTDTLLKLIQDFPQIKMLKHEDWPGLAKISALRADKGRQLSILVGNSGLFLPEELNRGANGAMTGFAYPEMLVQVCELHQSGNKERANDVFDMYLPMLRYEAQPGIGIALRKETLRRRGAIASAHVRAPGPKLSKEDLDDLTLLADRLDRVLEKNS